MKAEFRERQSAFDFATVALAVLDAAIETKKRLKSMLKTARLGWHTIVKSPFKKPRQLVLELNSLAQIPMFQ